MFGYVITDYTSLSRDAKHRYRQVYCGLCQTLCRNYGGRARWLLNYDTAFLLLILRALDNSGSLENCRCPYHFCKNKVCFTGKDAEYAADVTVLLSYLKFSDDIADDNSVRAKLLSRIYKNSFDKAKNRQPILCEKIITHLMLLSEAEKRDEQNPLVPADIFGRILGDVFGGGAYQFGYHLGRFIYLVDAASDFESDIKRGRYNPLIRCRKAEIKGLLMSVMNDCTDAYEALDIQRDNDIAENILYRGLWLKYNVKRKS